MKVKRAALHRVLERVAIIPWSGCWIWLGGVGADGYGLVRNDDGKMERVHRLVYRLLVTDPGDAMVLHSCDVGCCVNPAHLRAGDGFDNMADAIARDRLARGSARPNAKLTEDQVAEIKRSGLTLQELADRYGVHERVIFNIRAGRKWRHVQ